MSNEEMQVSKACVRCELIFMGVGLHLAENSVGQRGRLFT
jgi:hypothetical protein